MINKTRRICLTLPKVNMDKKGTDPLKSGTWGLFQAIQRLEMKHLRKTCLCLDLKFEHCSDGILVHQLNYTLKVLHFHYFQTIYSLDANEIHENIVQLKVSYLSSISVVLFFVHCIRQDISFAFDMLTRYSTAPIFTVRDIAIFAKSSNCYKAHCASLGHM